MGDFFRISSPNPQIPAKLPALYGSAEILEPENSLQMRQDLRQEFDPATLRPCFLSTVYWLLCPITCRF
ncbi:MAG: hypothetical protein R3264_12075, partial [Anaerolineae bacterium]|nr:hypothetical protein [Anaerolineae bacterium]